jgi:hypothetical protein
MLHAYLEWPVNLLTGATSSGSSASEYSEKPLGTCHMKTFPSSDPEAIMRSLKGFLGGSQHDASCDNLLHLPIRIKHRCSVPSEQRDLFRQTTFLIDGYNSKSSTTTGFPIHRKILRVGLEFEISSRPLRLQAQALTFTKLVSQALRLICKLS